MSTSFSLSSALRRSLAVAFVAGSTLAVAGAQTVPAAVNGTAISPANAQVPFPFTASNESALGSSSSLSSDMPNSEDAASDAATTNLATLEKGINLPGVNAQYGRRRYGAPRYRGANTNADGSEKYTVFVGGGFSSPAGTVFNYATTSYGFQVGGGRNFNKRFGVNVEFDYDHFGMTGQTLTNQQSLYNYYIGLYNATQTLANQIAPVSGLDGNNHVWSLSLDPTFTFHQTEAVGAYLIGGAGYYHKVANFTVQEEGIYVDPYGYEEPYVANQVIDHYTSNAPGFNGGVGFTYKFSRFANEKLYGEVRYVYVINSARAGVTVDNASPANADVANDFPQNSNHTSYIPVKFGIRF